MKRTRIHDSHAWLAAAVLVSGLIPGVVLGQMIPNPNFDPSVGKPAYTNNGPLVLFDEAHHNYHTSDGRYKPFVDLISNDGYHLTPNKIPFSKETLTSYDILVIANAAGGPPGSAERETPAFTEDEADAVRDWVEEGGSLLLIADHAPYGASAQHLAQRFGVDMSMGFVKDTVFFRHSPSWIIYASEHGTLLDHPITEGRDRSERVNRVITFTGQSLSGPESSTLLKLSTFASDQKRISDSVAVLTSAAGRAQAVALPLGQGRVVVYAEAALLTSQLSPADDSLLTGMDHPAGFDNRQLVLNTMHWLSGLLPERSERRPAPNPDFNPQVENPAYRENGPQVLLDEAHFTLYTAEGLYKPFVELIRRDGYRVGSTRDVFTPALLGAYDILVIAGARGADRTCSKRLWMGIDSCPASTAAFTEAEADVVRDWVRGGGALLLVSDVFPVGTAMKGLAARFGVELTGGHILDWENLYKDMIDWIEFSREKGTLLDHPITGGRDSTERVERVLTFRGHSVRGVDEREGFLRFVSPALEMLPGHAQGDSIFVKTTTAVGSMQGVARRFGEGRVVVLGDADVLTSQLLPDRETPVGLDYPSGYDNRQLALNIMHWLSGLL